MRDYSTNFRLKAELRTLFLSFARGRFSRGRGDCSPGPGPELIDILEHVYRHFVITHRVRLFTVGLKRFCACGLVLWPILIIHLEVQHVASDQAKEQVVVVEPDSAEHSFRGNLANASELVHDVVEIFFADWHGKRSLAGPAGLYGRENNSKPCLAAHHAFVSIAGALKRIDFG